MGGSLVQWLKLPACKLETALDFKNVSALINIHFLGSLHDREVVGLASDRQAVNIAPFVCLEDSLGYSPGFDLSGFSDMWRVHPGILTMLGLNLFGPEVLAWRIMGAQLEANDHSYHGEANGLTKQSSHHHSLTAQIRNQN